MIESVEHYQALQELADEVQPRLLMFFNRCIESSIDWWRENDPLRFTKTLKNILVTHSYRPVRPLLPVDAVWSICHLSFLDGMESRSERWRLATAHTTAVYRRPSTNTLLAHSL